MRMCSNYPELFDLTIEDIHGYCIKKPAIVSHISDKMEEEDMEPVGDKFVSRCTSGWARVGSRLCVPKCPLGWHVHGNQVMKKMQLLQQHHKHLFLLRKFLKTIF